MTPPRQRAWIALAAWMLFGAAVMASLPPIPQISIVPILGLVIAIPASIAWVLHAHAVASGGWRNLSPARGLTVVLGMAIGLISFFALGAFVVVVLGSEFFG